MPKHAGRAALAALALLPLAVSGLPRLARASPQFACFFDEGRTEPTARCRQAVARFAALWSQLRDGKGTNGMGLPLPAQDMPVWVSGHAGDPRYPGREDQIALLRAHAVADELLQAGIPVRLVTIRGYGNRFPLVPGAPGDPQNRRVEFNMGQGGAE